MDQVALITYAGNILRIALLLIVGIPLLGWVRNKFLFICSQRFSQHSCILLGRVIFYGGIIFIIVTILHELGFNITALLGVAGVFGVAIGFASQTSISNIISGFFLILERPFSIGDMIKCGDIVGIVESIDLLSLTIRTSDNKLARLPNEMVLKNSLINVTYYPNRRIDCVLSTPYIDADDIERMKSEMYVIIKNNTLFLHHPIPMIAIQKIAQLDYDTEIRIFFMIRVWVAKENFASAPAILMQQLKELFDKTKRTITIIHHNSN